MTKRFNKVGIFFLSLILILGLVACSNSEESGVEQDNEIKSSEIVDEILLEDSELPETNLVQISNKELDKSELGIKMTLTNDFADCIDKELTTEALANISPEAIGGFSLVKVLEGEEYVLSNLAVVPTTAIATPEESSRFPYLFTGNNYTLVATIPQITKTNGNAYQEVITIQSGIMIQLASINFDETLIVVEKELEAIESID